MLQVESLLNKRQPIKPADRSLTIMLPINLADRWTKKDKQLPQCGGSGMFIPDPGSWFLPIPDPGSRIQKQQQKRGVKKNLLSYLFCSPTFHKIANYFILLMLKKKIWPILPNIIELFTQKIVTKLSSIWVRDPGSRGQKGTGSRIRNTELPKRSGFMGVRQKGGQPINQADNLSQRRTAYQIGVQPIWQAHSLSNSRTAY